MSKLTVQEWEKKKNMVLQGDVDLEQSVTDEEFMKLVETQGRHGVDHETRMKFLKDNGYKVTRENLSKDLSAKE